VLGGKYRVERQLGEGGMGVVLSATHLELDAPVAIKVIRDELARNEEVVARMLFEARAAARLRSSHIVRVLDVARLESGAPYIVMERLDGADLASLLAESGPLPFQEVVDYVLQACEGLLEAHALGIIHRDLKPENLFRASTPEGFVLKVLDFGISKDTGVVSGLSPRSIMTNAGNAVGSPHYMSPEQMRAGDVDVRADIWSLGAILHELISGRCPFEGESLPVVCANVLSDAEATPLETLANHVPQGLSDVIARCLRKDRTQRFPSVAELAAALRAYASLDGQRSADRSSRTALGSGVQYKRDVSTLPAPLTVSSSPKPASPSLAARRSRSIAVAVLALSVLALGWAALRRPVAAPPTAAAPPSPAAERPSPAVTPTPSPSPASSIVAAVATPAAAAPGVEEPRAAAKRARPRASSAAVAAAPPAPASPASEPAAPKPAAPNPQPPANAWDPERLGGRY
jgi:serine/threonine-protein kinase